MDNNFRLSVTNTKNLKCIGRYINESSIKKKIINVIKIIKINLDFILQPIFLNELSLLSDLDTSGSGSGSINGFEVSDNTSKTLRLRDSKKAIILVAPSASECSLWMKRITEARKTFMENEKTRLQRQRSSEFRFHNICHIIVYTFIIFILQVISLVSKMTYDNEIVSKQIPT